MIRRVTPDVEDLAALGVTSAEIDVELKHLGGLHFDGTDWWAHGRQGEGRVADLLRQAQERAATRARHDAFTSGQVCRWKRLGGEWFIHGVGLTEGDIVTIEKRNGGTIQEVVGAIVKLLDDGTQIARVGQL